MKVIENVPPEPVLRLAALLHDCGKPACRTTDGGGRDHFYGHAPKGAKIAGEFLREFRFDNKTITDVVKLILHHDDHYPATRENVRREMNRVGEELFPSYLKLVLADNLSKSGYTLGDFMPLYKRICSLHEDITAAGDAITLKDLAVKGSDLIAAGMPPGPRMGEILDRMLDDVLADPSHNNKEYLLGKYLG